MVAKNQNGIPILRSNCCDYVGGLTEQTDFETMGESYRNRDVVVLNYISNEGGYNRITKEFIQGMNGYVNAPEYSMKLLSPVTEGRNCKRKWVIRRNGGSVWPKRQGFSPHRRKYDGVQYIRQCAKLCTQKLWDSLQNSKCY